MSLNESNVTLGKATSEEVLALKEFAQWAQKHKMLLATGRSRGIQFGVTAVVADFLRKSDEFVAANLVRI